MKSGVIEVTLISLIAACVLALILASYSYNVNKDRLVTALVLKGIPPAEAACIVERTEFSCEAAAKFLKDTQSKLASSPNG